MAIKGSGVNDTVRVLEVGINTDDPNLKKSRTNKINYSLKTKEVIILPPIDYTRLADKTAD